MEVRIFSSLVKLLPGEAPPPEPPPALTAARGEVCAFQFAVRTAELRRPLRFAVSGDLNTMVRKVETVPVRFAAPPDADDDYLGHHPGLYPDVLMPLYCGDRCCSPVPGEWEVFHVSVRVGADAAPGSHVLRIAFSRFDGESDSWVPEREETFTVEVAPVTLPEQKLLRLEWIHFDCIAEYYGVPAWSEEHWRLAESFIANAADHGVNVLYTPLWTPPLDTEPGGYRPDCQLLGIGGDGGRYEFDFARLGRFLALADKYRFARVAMSHLFTQWGARFTPQIWMDLPGGEQRRIFGWNVAADSEKYLEFLRQLFPALRAFLRSAGWEERVLFSLSDEPRDVHIEHYSHLVDLVSPILDGFPTVEALSEFDFFHRGLVKRPVCAVNKIEPFLGKAEELWGYYCCSQYREVPNRFIAMPLRRCRIIGVLAYVCDLAGFLQWGYNFYYSQLSRELLDPFFRTDCGGAFPAGDAFLVYPGKDGPLDSLRGEALREGFQDLRILRLLEREIGRDAVLKLLEELAGAPLTMSVYPRNDDFFFELRRRVFDLLSSRK